MRLVFVALLSTISAAAIADTHEDQAERACEAAGRSFYTVADAAHGRVSAVDTPAARDAYLKGFALEWNRYLTTDKTPPPTESLKPWLLDAWAHGISTLHTSDDIASSYGAKLSALQAENIRQSVLDAQDELNRHCMYALGKLDGEGRLLIFLGKTPTSASNSAAANAPRSNHR
ncbi:MAG TPA: hypothetical protein VEH54_06535 [Steroidobacteraceae bacterium]|nr:hypothetical protein [Steroidobacteraceae bacterium]